MDAIGGQLKRQGARLNRSAKRFRNLFHNPFFWTLTFVGNGIVLIGSVLLWLFESAANEGKISFLDCVLWSAGTVTTIGYGDSTPQTTPGKLVLLALMLFGTLFVWSYMAFLVTGLIAPEIAALEKDVEDVERELRELRRE